jgi:hypothetical protein
VSVYSLQSDILTARGLPSSIDIDLSPSSETEKDSGPIVDCQKVGSKSTVGLIGTKCSDKICNWFSVAIQRDVIVIRAIKGSKHIPRVDKLPYRFQGDQAQAFLSEAPLHLVNDHSVKQLR